jgi:hypothetical protein
MVIVTIRMFEVSTLNNKNKETRGKPLGKNQ